MSTKFKVRSTCGSIGCAAFIIVLLLLLFVSRIILRPTMRIPYELPVHELFEAQLQALGPTWTQDHSKLYTDDLFTQADWALYTKFNHTDYHYGASEELHTFANPILAKVWSLPSPRSVNIDERGKRPPGWNYSPSYADEFVLDCSQEDIPRFCYLIV